MGVIGTFGSFTAARMGIYSSMSAMHVVGNNIANINTEGYTRQRLDLYSLHSGGADRYANNFDVSIGYGVMVDGVSQVRDPYLDIRYRNENSSVGAAETTLNGLKQLAHKLDEVGKGTEDFGIIEDQFNDMIKQLETLHKNVGTEEYDTLVRSSASTLTQLLNDYAKGLETVYNDELASLHDDVDTVNGLLNDIRALNEQIRNAGIHGDKALELRDARNLAIDKLSYYMKVDVTYSMEPLDQYNEVEKLSISIADTGTPPIMLIDGVYGTQISIPEDAAIVNPNYDRNDPTKGGKYMLKDDDPEYQPDPNLPNYKVTTDEFEKAQKEPNDRLLFQLSPLVDAKGRPIRDPKTNKPMEDIVQLGDNTLYGGFQAKRELLTERGEFSSEHDLSMDPDSTTKRGIPYYQHSLDALARTIAQRFNEANQLPPETVYQTKSNVDPASPADTYFLDKDGNQVLREDGTPIFVSDLELGKDLTEAEYNAQMSKICADLNVLREKAALDIHYTYYDGGVMFSNNGNGNDASGITAKNISISHAWSTSEIRVLNSSKPNDLRDDGTPILNSSANDNIDHIIYMMKEKIDWFPKTGYSEAVTENRFFNGNIQEMFTNVSGTLSKDQQRENKLYESYYQMALDLDNDRSSVSGVDLNEEATNMMQFQKSYSAACRLLTTIDSMLDKLINGTAI